MIYGAGGFKNSALCMVHKKAGHMRVFNCSKLPVHGMRGQHPLNPSPWCAQMAANGAWRP